ncbi:MAG: NAD-dependent succinate-semialdehyde dehydrogenase [Rhodococcus sp.]|nr:NAD-dependent succinate-semialdehyde dehydrogenase [Rhodococcus sp. (in: high G+C Gram-positive bacteria)]MCX6491938.1 NAD-dependent succinate-semialdehyde dehydrogenase [Rhodococcus sp. (in: high G+C Gram-positive bacteria)]
MDQRALIDSIPAKLWIGGKAVDAEGGKTFAVNDPATGKPLTEVADASPADAMKALDAAAAAQKSWAATPARERSEILRAAFEKVTERADDIALLMTMEMGKALAESKAEVKYGAEFFRWFAEEAVRIGGRYTPAPAGNGRILVTKAPVGPVLAITPWNFPLAMGTRKIGPALAAGCTIVVKPARETPLTMLLLAQIFDEVGLPEGVLSVLTTSKSGDVTGPLLEDPRLRKLTFTGSTGVGKSLVEKSATRLLRTSMELGGNAPFVVFDDANIDDAVDGAMLAKMRNGGEACTAANRLHVHNSVREEFTTKLVAKMSEMKLGPGVDPDTKLGPLIKALGGSAPGGDGYFYPATVLTDMPTSARILKEEVFGPVAPIVGFDTEQEGIDAANATEYGLASYIYTESLDRALRVADAIDSGMVGVNRGVISDAAAPFGGVKESGFGREGGSEGIEEYLETKYIALK